MAPKVASIWVTSGMVSEDGFNWNPLKITLIQFTPLSVLVEELQCASRGLVPLDAISLLHPRTCQYQISRPVYSSGEDKFISLGTE